MTRRVWVLPPSWPSDQSEHDSGAASEHPARGDEPEKRRGLRRLRVREKARESSGSPAASEIGSAPKGESNP